MSHKAQVDYCNEVKFRFPKLFINKDILDVGSMDINGNNRRFFDNVKSYVGLDIGPGKNVDVICPIHLYEPNKQFDFIISTECFEHDKYWRESIRKIYDLTKVGGAMLLTIAGHNRPEHGTTATTVGDSPYTNDYYKNIYAKDILEVLNVDEEFTYYEISYDGTSKDIRFMGIKGEAVAFNPKGING